MSKDLANDYEPDHVIYDAPIGTAYHKAIFCCPKWNKASPPILRWHKVFDYRQSNLDQLFHHAYSVDWDTLLCDNDLDVLWTKVHNCILELIKRHIPSRTVPMTNKDKEWMRPITKMLVMDKWDAFRSRNWSMYHHLKIKVK